MSAGCRGPLAVVWVGGKGQNLKTLGTDSLFLNQTRGRWVGNLGPRLGSRGGKKGGRVWEGGGGGLRSCWIRSQTDT